MSKKNQNQEELCPSYMLWIVGTVLSSMIPFLAALFQFIQSDFKDNFITDINLCDTLALSFSVSLNCFLVCLGRKKKINIIFRRILFWISLIFAIITFAWYFFAEGFNKQYKNAIVFAILIGICFADLIMGFLHEYLSSRSNRKKSHEK